jgi:O-antigen ligase
MLKGVSHVFSLSDSQLDRKLEFAYSNIMSTTFLYRKIFNLVLGVGIVCLPLTYHLQAEIAYEIPKVWLVWRWVEGLIVISLVGLVGSATRVRLNNRMLAMMTAYVLVIVVASWFGVDWEKSVWGNYYRKDGLLTLFHLVGLAMVIGIWYNKLLNLTIQRATCLGFLLLIGSLWLHKTGVDGAPFGLPNFLAGYLAVIVPILGSMRPWGSFLVIMTAVVVWLAQSVGSIMALGLYGGISLSQRVSVKGRILIALAGMVAVGLIVVNYISQDFNAEGRERIFRRAFAGWQQRPWLGWGVGNVDYAIQSNQWPLPMFHDVYVDKAHSHALEYLVTTGAIGLLLYTVMAGYVLWQLGLKKEFHWLIVFILFLFHSQTNVVSIAEEVYFWLAIGVALRQD